MSKARELAELGAVYDSSALSNRNLVINGAMQVSQRATTATGVGGTNGVYPTLDRYRFIIGGSSTGRFTMSQEADGPVGFANSLKMACTTADTSIAADERMFLQHKIEAQDCQAIGKGETGAKPITVSFYVKANAAKTYGLEVFESNSSRQCTKLFNVTTDWTRVVLNFPADVDDGSSPIPDTTVEGIVLQWQLHAGSNFTSGTLNSSAFADSVNANRAGGIDSFYSSTSNTFFITGVQLEIGTEATPFEHRSFGDELAKCQRYYYRISCDATHDGVYAVGNAYTSDDALCAVPFPVAMRAEPTLGFQTGASGHRIRTGAGSSQQTSALHISAFDNTNFTNVSLTGTTTTTNLTTGDAAQFRISTNDFIDFDAEL